MSAPAIDEARLEEFMGRMVGYMTGGAACLGIWLGDLGLWVLGRYLGRRVLQIGWVARGASVAVARGLGLLRRG